MKKTAGIAFDIGTTTIAAALAEPGSGRIIRGISLPNPQGRWGADVLARVAAIRQDPGLLAEMSRAVAAACNEAISALAPGEPVVELSAAGNPVMEHIFLNISPIVFAGPPFRPVFKQAVRVEAGQLGVDAAPGALVYVFPLIGGFVGGDTVAVITALGLLNEAAPTLAIDIGTNSEIVLAVNGALYATSAAAGPAFEGGGIACGMTARPGAIAGVTINNDNVVLDVIGNAAPTGICGSGLIDAAAALLEAGVIDCHGRIKGSAEVSTNIGNRIKEREDGNVFVLYRGARAEIALTQADIRALQNAKAAIRAGVSILLSKAGITAEGLGKVYLAGAFGGNLRKEALARIGLLDPAWPAWQGGVNSVGDAALLGAAGVIGSEEKKREAETVASMVKYVALSGSSRFEREFLKEMNF